MAIVKKAAKKTAKKAAKKGAKQHGGAHDLRRAYEHVSRVRTLHLGLQPEALKMVDTLSRMAQAAMQAEDGKSAAEYLRAAEHVAFGYLSATDADESLTLPLLAAANDLFDDLVVRAEEEAVGAKGDVRALYKTLLSEANHARMGAAYSRALEFARAAEALTHAKPVAVKSKLPAGRAMLHLR